MIRQALAFISLIVLADCASVSPELKEAQQLQQSGNLRGALAQYEQALEKTSSRQQKAEIAEEIQRVRGQIANSVLREIESTLASGQSIPALEQAVTVLKRESRYDNATGDLARALQEHTSALNAARGEYEKLSGELEKAEKEDAWSSAASILRKLDALHPSPALNERMAKLIERRDLYVPYLIEKLVESRNVDAAEDELNRFRNELPKPSDALLTTLQSKVDLLRQELLEAKVEELAAQKKYYTAYKLIENTGYPYLKKFLPAITAEGAAFYKQKAAKELQIGGAQLGYAYFAAEKAFELMPSDSDAFRLRREISDIIDHRITQQISIDAFTSPGQEPEAGVALSNTLMEHLMNNVPYGIQILERRKIEQSLQEVGAQRADLESKVKMWIAGDVTTLTVERQRTTGEGTARVEKGKTRRPNTEYARYVEDYGRDKSRWPEEMRHLTPEIEEPIVELVKYNYGEEALNGIMVVSVRNFEGLNGVVKAVKVFKSNLSTNDSFNDEVALATPKIERDALQLPTDNAIKEVLRNDLAKQIGLYVLSAFENREAQFLKSAKTSIARREFHLAVADLAGGHYYAHKDSRYIPDPNSNAATQELRQLGFFDYTE